MINNEYSRDFESITGLQFEAFYKQHRPKLVWHLARFTKDHSKAEDFVDEAFMQGLLKIKGYNKEKSQIHTWIYKIGENIVKKEYNDSKRMTVCSLDSNNSTDGNLTLTNVIAYKDSHEKIEKDMIIEKKAEIVKKAIYKLPEKYKKVMILREIKKIPYSEISDMCTKDYDIDLTKESKDMPFGEDFLDINLINNSQLVSYVTVTYNNGLQLQMEVEPNGEFNLDKYELDNITNVNICANGNLTGVYRVSTKLSTIKSQIGKGRRLIQGIVKRDFMVLEKNGINPF